MGSAEKHAVLSPSSAKRWLACPPSVRLEEGFPDRTSEAAEEGTLAHELGELMLQLSTSAITQKDFDKRFRKIKKHRLYKDEMVTYCRAYEDYVLEAFIAAKKLDPDAVMDLEQQVDISDFFPESFGTVDDSIVFGNTLCITDLKYGKGVPVSAVDNPQLRSYALGAWKKYSLVYDIKYVVMRICQPRLDSNSEDMITVEDLIKWGEEQKPKAEQAFRGEGELNAGDHCMFCKVKATCRKRAEVNLESAREELLLPPILTDDEVLELLPKLEAIQKWASDLKEYAFDRAKEGHKWNGYKLVAGRANRKYADEKLLIKRLKELGFTHGQIHSKKLKGLTEMKGTIGKEIMEMLELENHIIRPEGKPTLVPESDKRPELNSKDSAVKDFEEDIDNSLI